MYHTIHLTLVIICIYCYICIIIRYFGLFKYLDKRTRYADDKYILSTKYSMLFVLCNVFCLLFIKQLKHKREIDFYKNYIRTREFCCTSYTLKEDKKYFLYKRLLKLEKILK